MIGVIADDLTGAAELGAVGVRHGLRAEIVLRGKSSGQSNLVCLDTDSRFCAPEESRRRAAAAANLLRESRADWIYKKVDSVLRGQVTVEVDAIRNELGLPLALLVSANPSLGRITCDGCYFVRGRPLHQTEFARDPVHPRTSARLLDLLGVSDGPPITVRSALDPLPKFGIIAGEAASTDDLRAWATRRGSDMLPAGGAEFFAALLVNAGCLPGAPAASAELESNAASKPSFSSTMRTHGSELFISGSTSESLREFLAAEQTRGICLLSLPAELARGAEFSPQSLERLAAAAAAALQPNRRVILHVGLPLILEPDIAKSLSSHLVTLAQNVLHRAKPAHIFAEGGATAAELVRRMGWQRLEVLQEMALGVATLAVDGDPALLLTMKPGSYVWPEAVRRPQENQGPKKGAA